VPCSDGAFALSDRVPVSLRLLGGVGFACFCFALGVRSPARSERLGVAVSRALTAAATSSGKDSVSQAPCAAVQHDVFNRANFFALGGLNWPPNELARLNVTGAAGSALGLGECRTHGAPQNRHDARE
jgi:hypothetical protein